ncbi:MAG: hypothetical protein LBH43_01565 [Treponema sp.]|nr:hypothetical protein [Treponema sp.]
MDGKTALLTVMEMAQELGISSAAVNKRLQRKDRKPCKYIGTAGMYTKADLEAIRDGGKRGRPKVEEDKPPAMAKQKTTAKKT